VSGAVGGARRTGVRGKSKGRRAGGAAVSRGGVRHGVGRRCQTRDVRHVGIGREAVAGRMSEAWVSGGRAVSGAGVRHVAMAGRGYQTQGVRGAGVRRAVSDMVSGAWVSEARCLTRCQACGVRRGGAVSSACWCQGRGGLGGRGVRRGVRVKSKGRRIGGGVRRAVLDRVSGRGVKARVSE
jgi:hypothetical protein